MTHDDEVDLSYKKKLLQFIYQCQVSSASVVFVFCCFNNLTLD